MSPAIVSLLDRLAPVALDCGYHVGLAHQPTAVEPTPMIMVMPNRPSAMGHGQLIRALCEAVEGTRGMMVSWSHGVRAVRVEVPAGMYGDLTIFRLALIPRSTISIS